MYAIVVNLECNPGAEDAFLKAALDDASNSVQEPGCVRFDAYQDQADPKRFVFVEVYRDEDAFKAHTQTDHFARWNEATKDIRASASVVRCTNLHPTDAGWR